MKKALILAYDFPPLNSAGAIRPFGWYNNFNKYGVYPILVTRHWDENIKTPSDFVSASIDRKNTIEETVFGTIIKVPYNQNLRDKFLTKFGFDKFVFFRKFLGLFFLLFQHLSYRFDNKRNIYLTAKEYLENNKVDVIISTGEPFILFKYAYLLSKQFKIKWIADYRDIWIKNFNLPLKFYFKKIERKYISSASIITTTAPYLVDNLKTKFKIPIYLIANGYDEIKFNVQKKNSDKFSIAYIGSLYDFQPLEEFIDTFTHVINKYKDERIEICFYGLKFDPQQLKRLMNISKNISNHIKILEKLSKENLYNKVNENTIALLLAIKDNTPLAVKVFDYIYLKKKIILFKNDHNILEKIIDDCDAGVKCENKEEAIKAIEDSYLEWKETGKVKCNAKNLEKYSREYQTKKFAELINENV